mmetsp:Transcript_41276/g.110326  ORF Transcript_41276/g.110326 Transcript_41276/m.110326 type:complete len:249 (+) Transcript_41276:280-1026(+)
MPARGGGGRRLGQEGVIVCRRGQEGGTTAQAVVCHARWPCGLLPAREREPSVPAREREPPYLPGERTSVTSVPARERERLRACQGGASVGRQPPPPRGGEQRAGRRHTSPRPPPRVASPPAHLRTALLACRAGRNSDAGLPPRLKERGIGRPSVNLPLRLAACEGQVSAQQDGFTAFLPAIGAEGVTAATQSGAQPRGKDCKPREWARKWKAWKARRGEGELAWGDERGGPIQRETARMQTNQVDILS